MQIAEESLQKSHKFKRYPTEDNVWRRNAVIYSFIGMKNHIYKGLALRAQQKHTHDTKAVGYTLRMYD